MKIGTAPRTFQELIFGLQRYWSDQGMRNPAAYVWRSVRHFPHGDLFCVP